MVALTCFSPNTILLYACSKIACFGCPGGARTPCRKRRNVIEEGSLYPALQRLLKAELVKAEWGVSSTNRRVRTYELTKAGAKHLEQEVSRFERMLDGITRVLAADES